MSRRPRIEIENGLFHVTNRGLERRNIVHDDHDRGEWLRLLGRVATRCRWRVFAHVLLDNHFHLFLRTPETNLSAGMHDLESGYASQFNRRHERSGPLYQDRFHAVAVEDQSHAWELSRYIHLNPVRAGLVTDPGRYQWSSYRCYLDARTAPAWLDWRTVLGEFSGTESAARIAFRRFVNAGIQGGVANPLAQVVDGWILGGPEFVDRCRRLTDTLPVSRPTIDQIAHAVARKFDTTIETVHAARRHGNQAREAALLLVRELRADALKDVAARFGGVSRSAVTEITRRARHREERDESFRKHMEALRDELR